MKELKYSKTLISDATYQWRIKDFTGWGANSRGREVANLLFGITFAENCMKIKKNGRVRRAWICTFSAFSHDNLVADFGTTLSEVPSCFFEHSISLQNIATVCS